jgi:hypothetical protein
MLRNISEHRNITAQDTNMERRGRLTEEGKFGAGSI